MFAGGVLPDRVAASARCLRSHSPPPARASNRVPSAVAGTIQSRDDKAGIIAGGVTAGGAIALVREAGPAVARTRSIIAAWICSSRRMRSFSSSWATIVRSIALIALCSRCN